MKYKMLWVILSFTLITTIVIFSCSGPDEPTYGSDHPDPNPTGMTAPEVDSLSPSEGYLKDIIKIYGSGFNSTPEYNLVSFGKNVGTIMDATSNMLTVQTPNISNDTVDVRVSIKGSEYWSQEESFIFKNTLETIDEEIVWPNGVAVDANGNVYVGSADEGVIYKITPDGDKTEFASVPISGSMRFGPQNYLYVCEQGEEKIERISPDGSTVEEVVSVPGPVAFDWDQNGNMYIIENESGIHRLDPSGTLTYMTDLSTAKCCRVFGNYLYVTAIWDGKISRFEITAGGLGEEEVVMEDLDSPVGIDFDVEGTMYYTLAWETSLYTLKEDGTEEVLYDGELQTPMHYINFQGKKMFIVFPGWGDVGMTLSAYIGVEQAPNYGLQ
jgi:outer membrane protein assembly factor BamB